MNSRLTWTAFVLAVVFGTGRAVADEPATPSTPSTTTPSTTTPSTATPSTTTPSTTGTKPATTGVITGKVAKISDTSLTLKISYQTSKTKTNPRGKAHTATKTVTYEIAETPPVKVVNGTSRTTGSFADVKVGDLVSIGTGPHIVKTGDGKSTTHTRVTGIDVVKNTGATTSTSPASPAKP